MRFLIISWTDEPSLSSTIVIDRSSSSCVMTPLIGVFLGRVRSSRLVVISWMSNSSCEVEILSRIESSTVVVDWLLSLI